MQKKLLVFFFICLKHWYEQYVASNLIDNFFLNVEKYIKDFFRSLILEKSLQHLRIVALSILLREIELDALANFNTNIKH